MSSKPTQAQALEQLTGEAVSWKIAGLPPKFRSQILHRQDIHDQIKELEAKKKELDDAITLTMAQHDLKGVFVDSYRASLIESSRSTLSKEKLLEAGVEAEIILGATVTSHYSFLRVDDTEKGKAARKEKASGVTPIRKKKGVRK
jgi:hypothetical protein